MTSTADLSDLNIPETLQRQVADLRSHRHAASTRDAYRKAWRRFSRWATDRGVRAAEHAAISETNPDDLLAAGDHATFETLVLTYLMATLGTADPPRSPNTLSVAVRGIAATAADRHPSGPWAPSGGFSDSLRGLKADMAARYGNAKQATALNLRDVIGVAEHLCLPQPGPAADRAVFELAVLGVTRADMVSATVADVHLTGRHPRLVTKPAHSRRRSNVSRVLPLAEHDHARDALAVWLAVRPNTGSDRLFAGNTSAGNTSNVSQRIADTFARIRRITGVDLSTLNSDSNLDAARIDAARQMLRRRDRHAQRDHAALLIGFFAGLRRSELLGLRIGDVTCDNGSLVIQVRHSKTDQMWKGAQVRIDRIDGVDVLDTPAVVQRWIDTLTADVTGTTTGSTVTVADQPLFPALTPSGGLADSGAMDAQHWSERLNQIVRAAGIYDGLADADVRYRNVSGHSLRRGIITTAVDAGVDLTAVKQHVRHSDLSMTSRYVDDLVGRNVNWNDTLHRYLTG